jgi:hypothetical protein
LALMESARKPDWSEWPPERKELILQGILAGVARQRRRRRVLRAFAAAAACAALLVGLALKLAGVDAGTFVRTSPELADKSVSQRVGVR